MKWGMHWHEIFAIKKVFKKRLFEKNKYICYRIGFLLLVRVTRIIKEESGENPEQSRCCEARDYLETTFATE